MMQDFRDAHDNFVLPKSARLHRRWLQQDTAKRSGPDQGVGEAVTPACNRRWDVTGIIGNTALVNSRYQVRILQTNKNHPQFGHASWTNSANGVLGWKKSLKNTGFKWGQITSPPGGGSTCLGAGPGINPHGVISWVHKNIQDKLC
jgi:hypothetical protein